MKVSNNIYQIEIKALILFFAVWMVFGCGKQISTEQGIKSTSSLTYEAHALMKFHGEEGPGIFPIIEIKNHKKNNFDDMVKKQFKDLWAKVDRPFTGEQSPVPGVYTFEPTEGFVTLSAEATDPDVAIITANAVARAVQILYENKAQMESDESVQWLVREADKQVIKLRGIEDEILDSRKQNETHEQLRALMIRRDEQEERVKEIRDLIEEERLKHDQRAVSVHILEQAEKAFQK